MNPTKNGKAVLTRKCLPKALLLLSFLTAGTAFAQSAVIQTASLAPASMQAPYAVSAQNAPQAQSLDELGLIAEQFLIDKTRDLPGKTEIAITPLDSRLKLPACRQPVAYLSQGARIWGRTTVAIRCEAPEVWRIMVKAHVRIHTDYLAAAKVLPQGHVIRESDLVLVNGDITAMRPGVLTGKEHAIGRTVTRSMQPGTAIWAEHLRAKQAIQQGQTVRIISRGPGFSISGEGLAINSAGEGQVAKAKMPNGSIIRGIAKADGVIEINF
ncbi:flagellar basal body P-ring formation protein FlgA [Oxalobacter sp. OttesenSCG-928-P03]|nr:flagellar basal body P-ring formation protein FlgA [Oxalobacter sp. OttesenSCG-928-P03]